MDLEVPRSSRGGGTNYFNMLCSQLWVALGSGRSPGAPGDKIGRQSARRLTRQLVTLLATNGQTLTGCRRDIGEEGEPGGGTGRSALALGSLNYFAFVAEVPAATHAAAPIISNPTNDLRPTAVGAFILPSVVGTSATGCAQFRTCDMPFERATECEANRGDPASLAKRHKEAVGILRKRRKIDGPADGRGTGRGWRPIAPR